MAAHDSLRLSVLCGIHIDIMVGKRKRSRPGHESHGHDKRQRISGVPDQKDPVIKSAVLARYYPQVLTLREYLLSKLPPASKIRRKKIRSVGRNAAAKEEDALAKHLDQTLVGVLKYKEISQEERLQQWSTFSQRVDTSDSNVENTSVIAAFSQVEVCRYLILSRIYNPSLFKDSSLTSFTDRVFRYLALIL